MSPSGSSKICIDPSGNLTLRAGTQKNRKAFIVNTVALSLASPAWRAMLNPDGYFLEAHSKDGEVTFHDDDPPSLPILLHIAHLQFQKVPKSLTVEELYNVAILCDKYDLVRIARPWIPKWFGNFELALLQGEENVRGKEGQWLFIAWTFGDVALFQNITKQMCLSFTLDKIEAFSKPDTNIIDIDSSIIAKVRQKRGELLTAILSVCQKHVDKLHSKTGTTCIGESDNIRCDLHMLSCLMDGLAEASLWPIPKTSEVKMSVREVVKHFHNIRMTPY